jgi:hypothetical protein
MMKVSKARKMHILSSFLLELRLCSIEAFRAFLGVSCDRAIVIANVMGITAFGLCMLICFIVVKKRFVER